MKSGATPGDRSPESDGESLNAAAIATIRAAVVGAGYKLRKETKKLSAFESPNGQVLYLDKLHSNLNDIRLLVHPRHERETLARLDDTATVSAEHRFHSNMSGFPNRINRGKTPTSYGWQVRIETSGTLSRFLSHLTASGG